MSYNFSVPITAPVITDEAEKAEKQALTDEERKQIVDDIYGTDDKKRRYTEQDLVNSRAAMEEALSRIPDHLKRDYMEAVTRCPEVVRRESGLDAFLRCEELDANAAARRVVDYWSIRKKVFGSDLAFQPLTMDGAMANHLGDLEQGICQTLPADEKDRLVLFLNRTRATPDVIQKDAYARVVFYMLHVATESISVQERGFVGVVNIRGFELYKHFDRNTVKRTSAIVQAVPAKIRAVHFILGHGHRVLENIIFPVVKYVLGKRLRHRLNVHKGDLRDIHLDLQKFGIKPENLCEVLGGRIDDSDFRYWLDERHALEGRRSEAGPPGD